MAKFNPVTSCRSCGGRAGRYPLAGICQSCLQRTMDATLARAITKPFAPFVDAPAPAPPDHTWPWARA